MPCHLPRLLASQIVILVKNGRRGMASSVPLNGKSRSSADLIVFTRDIPVGDHSSPPHPPLPPRKLSMSFPTWSPDDAIGRNGELIFFETPSWTRWHPQGVARPLTLVIQAASTSSSLQNTPDRVPSARTWWVLHPTDTWRLHNVVRNLSFGTGLISTPSSGLSFLNANAPSVDTVLAQAG